MADTVYRLQKGVSIRALSSDGSRSIDMLYPEPLMQCFALSSDGNSVISSLQSSPGLPQEVATVFSEDQRLIATLHLPKRLRILDARTGLVRLEMSSAHSRRIMCLAFSPDGQLIATGGADNRVKIWNTTTGDKLHRLNWKRPTSLAFSPDSRLLVSGNDKGTMRMWDLRTREVLLPDRQEHTRGVFALAFSPDGRHLASLSNNTVMLWDALSMEKLHTLTDYGVACIAFSHDGKRLVYGGSGSDLSGGLEDITKVRVWDVASGKLIKGLILRGCKWWPNHVAFTRDDREVTFASFKDVWRWDIWKYEMSWTPRRHRDFSENCQSVLRTLVIGLKKLETEKGVPRVDPALLELDVFGRISYCDL